MSQINDHNKLLSIPTIATNPQLQKTLHYIFYILHHVYLKLPSHPNSCTSKPHDYTTLDNQI